MSIVVEPHKGTTEIERELNSSIETREENEENSYVIPDKFKEKSTEEVVQSYLELEKRLGEQANEIGTLRQFTDKYIKHELDKDDTKTSEDSKSKITYDDILEDPDSAIEQTIASNPRIKALEEKIAASERLSAQSSFEEKHPDFMDIAQDVKFQEWVTGSKVRAEMYNKANNYDFDTADELMSTWKERTELINSTVKTNEATQKRDKDLKAAATESSSTGAKADKTFSRSELINKRIYDPVWYEANREEIMRAYQTGNIRP